MKTALKLILSTAVVLVGDSPQAQQKSEYRLRFEKGWSYSTHRTVTETLALAAAENPVVVNQKTEHVELSDIEQIDREGNAWVRYTLQWVRFEQTSGSHAFVYDSRTDEFPQ